MSRWMILVAAVLVVGVMAMSAGQARAAKPTETDANGVETAWEHNNCATIQSGTITDSVGNPVALGYDPFGYHYQAHMLNGRYDSADRNLDGTYWGILAITWTTACA